MLDSNMHEKIKSATNTVDSIVQLNFSIYSSILSINSVLIGSFGIVASLAPSINNGLFLICATSFLTPMLCIFVNLVLMRQKNIKSTMGVVIESLESSPVLMEQNKKLYREQKRKTYIDSPFWLNKSLENAGIWSTIFNAVLFLFIVYISK